MSEKAESVKAEIVEPGSLSVIEQAEIDVQIATAKRYPRVVSDCLDLAEQLLTQDKETAQSAFFELPAFGDSRETVMGPSIRCAEIVASCWGHLSYGSYPVEIGEREVKAVGFCRDRQTNTEYRTVKSRQIVNKHGKRYADHLIIKTVLAAQAIAERDAICKVVPRAFVQGLYKKALAVAEGDESLDVRISKAVKLFAGLGVDEAALMVHLAIEDRRDMTLRHVRYLRGVYNAVRAEETTIDDVFAKPKAKPKTVDDIVEQSQAQDDDPPFDADTGEIIDAEPEPQTEADGALF